MKKVRAWCIDMSKKKRNNSKNRRNFVAIPFSSILNLGTLADNIVVIDGLTSVFVEDIFIISIDALWSIRALAVGEVPLIFGFTHDDLTVTEIAENLAAELVDPDDIITRERARRPVRKVGQFTKAGSAEESINNGNILRTRIKMKLGDGHTLAAFVQNKSGTTLTTGAIVEIIGTIYGRWIV